MKRTIAVVAALIAALIGGTAATSAAQGVQTGTIRGVVVDSQGLPIPSVTVTLSSPALQGQRTTTTDAAGTYVFRTLPPGDYQIRYETTAFAAARQTATVPLGGTIEQNVALQAANVTEQVEVVGSVPAPITTPAI